MKNRINIGTASIILIFIILCLAVFSLLSLSDGNSALVLARRRADSVTAYYQADAALLKYRSAEKALNSAQVAFRYEAEKYAAGRSTTFDYNDAKTRMQKAESDQIQAKYEFIFRTKILDFYAGFPLTL